MKRLAMLISGGGTTMAAILEACKGGGSLHGLIEPALVIASRPDIRGIARAKEAGLTENQVQVCIPRSFPSYQDFGFFLLCHLQNWSVDLVGQYGWLPKTPVNVIETYKGRIINQHPGPLDTGRLDFGGEGMYGRRVHCARLYFARQSGLPRDQFTEATAHLVTEAFDQGGVIAHKRIPILPSDDVITLQERVLPVEHQLQIETLELLATCAVQPIARLEPLVLTGMEGLLEESKRVAGLLFPNG